MKVALPPLFKKSAKIIIYLLVTLLLVVAAYFYIQYKKNHPATDDAYVQAHVITVASQLNGKIKQVFIENQQSVKKNQLLFTLDPIAFQLAYDKALANLKDTQQQVTAGQHAATEAQAVLLEQEAQLEEAKKNNTRVQPLVKRGYYSKSGGDEAIRRLATAEQAVRAANAALDEAKAKVGDKGTTNAKIQMAKAAVAQAKLDLSYTEVRAPADGQLVNVTIQPGQTVTAYQSLFSLVDIHRWWVSANMKETDLEKLRTGQTATITLDMYPKHPFHGVVKSISPGSGASFALLPPENATGNWVKVTQRFPVDIDISNADANFPLRIGASCEVTIDTRDKHV